MGTDEIIKLLEGEYGIRKWHTAGDPLSVLIQTVLSQNTSDVNSHRAFNSLVSFFADWEAVAFAPVENIADVIKSGGLSQVKAGRIKRILNDILEEKGRVNLEFLALMNMVDAKEYLMHFPGVGHKTASCVLLFSLGRPCLPVDTHVFRVARRLGLLGFQTTVVEAHDLLQEQVPPSRIYQFHMHMVEHGRKVCRARGPLCERCVLLDVCTRR